MRSGTEAAHAWWIGAILAAAAMLVWSGLGDWAQSAAWTVAASAAMPSFAVALATLLYVVVRELCLHRRMPAMFVRSTMDRPGTPLG